MRGRFIYQCHLGRRNGTKIQGHIPCLSLSPMSSAVGSYSSSSFLFLLQLFAVISSFPNWQCYFTKHSDLKVLEWMQQFSIKYYLLSFYFETSGSNTQGLVFGGKWWSSLSALLWKYSPSHISPASFWSLRDPPGIPLSKVLEIFG